MSKNSIPPIKFKIFLNHWSNTELKEVKDVRDGTHSSPKYIDNGYPLVTSKNLTDSGLNLNDVSLISESDYNEINKRSKVEVGDILLGLIGTIGKPVLVEIDGFAIKNVGLIKNGGKIQNQFLLQYLKTNLFNKYIQIEMAGNTQKFLGLETLRNTKVPVPSPDEQSAIGSLFRTLDDLLASYKDNLTNYQSLKTTMLAKMFPKAGQTVPEIRLDGFEGEWEVVNLGTLIENYDEIISGVSGFPIATSSRTGLYLQSDYFEGGRTGIDLTLDFHRVPMGYVTYRHMSDDSIFKFNKNNFETDVLVSKEYPVFISNDSSDIDFLLYHLNNSKLFLRFSTMQKLGGTRVRLYYKNLITYKLAVPTLKEQQAIGAYFSNLDNLINSHQEKISQLETLKKKLLQDMFI